LFVFTNLRPASAETHMQTFLLLFLEITAKKGLRGFCGEKI